MQYKLGFVGVGIMAGAILDRAINNLEKIDISAKDIIIFDLDANKMTTFCERGVVCAKSSSEVFESSEIVILGVKPQYYASILGETLYFNCKTLVSIMAGIKIITLRKSLGDSIGITRVMPNTPCLVGKGMMAMCFDNVLDADKLFIENLFKTSGEVLIMAEEKFDAVTSISGSGPAYIYMVASGLIKGGIEGGLTYDESRKLALQTIEGAAVLASISPLNLDALVENVCSKGGTTIEAVNIYREKGLENLLKEGVTACRNKSKELSDKL